MSWPTAQPPCPSSRSLAPLAARASRGLLRRCDWWPRAPSQSPVQDSPLLGVGLENPLGALEDCQGPRGQSPQPRLCQGGSCSCPLHPHPRRACGTRRQAERNPGREAGKSSVLLLHTLRLLGLWHGPPGRICKATHVGSGTPKAQGLGHLLPGQASERTQGGQNSQTRWD